VANNQKIDSPINNLQQIMAVTAEECGELTQVCMKIIRKYSDKKDIESEWHDKLVEEAGDVLCMIELLVENGYLTNRELGVRVNEKRIKLSKWSDLINEQI
jgi:NTP pyrophosphatase (non-canonical NTP hydrolase)